MRNTPGLSKSLAVAALAALAAWLSRLLLTPIFGDSAPFITFYPMVIALAWWGGLRPTLFATLFSTLLLVYFVLEPKYSPAIFVMEYRLGLCLYIGTAVATGWLGEKLHEASRRIHESKERAVTERERLRVTLESIADAVVVTDLAGRVTSLNASAERASGWKHPDALGRSLNEVFPIVDEQTREAIQNPASLVLETRAPVALGSHTLLRVRDGSELPIDASASPILDAAGVLHGVVVVFRDVSAKRAADRQLLRTQRELGDFFENAAIPLHSLGPDGVILRANQAELSMLGYTREEYVGKHISQFHVDRQKIDEMLARLTRGETVINCEARLRCKDGSVRDVLVTSSALWENGRFMHTRSFTRDVTDRKMAEDSLAFLASASASLAALVDRESALQQSARIAVPYLADWCVVYVVDDHGAIDYHAHAHRDPEMEAILAKMLTNSPLDWNSNTATVNALKTGKSQLMVDLDEGFLDSVAQGEEHRQIIRKLGPRAVISVPLKIREQTIGVIGLVSCDAQRRYSQREVQLAENLAERVATAVDNAKLYHAVKEANRQKDEFLAMLAHELRNPLAAIRYAIALGQLSPDESPEELFEVIDRQTQNLAHLIDDLLDVSRISGNKISLRKEGIDVGTIIQRAVAAAKSLIEQKKHTLTVTLAEEPLFVFADPTRVEQIVANLLTNAAKYTKTGGRITVLTRRENGEVAIRVSDTGVGMPPEMLSRVFDLFAQADRTLDRSEGGLGIGLTIARKLAEMHDGTVTAESEGLGKGATFTLRLPIYQAPINGAPIPDGAKPQVERALRVLVVDDNHDTALSCAQLLRVLGHQVATAFDGPSAVREAQKFRPQALFLDIGLPGMNGYDVAKTLRQEGFDDCLLVAVSGYGQAQDRERSKSAGFDLHLVKPVDQVALTGALRCYGQRTAMSV